MLFHPMIVPLKVILINLNLNLFKFTELAWKYHQSLIAVLSKVSVSCLKVSKFKYCFINFIHLYFDLSKIQHHLSRNRSMI